MLKIGAYIDKVAKLLDNVVSLVILFLLMVLIPLTANFFIYNKVKTSVTNEVDSGIEKVINELTKQMDKTLYVNENMVLTLQSRKEVKQLIYSENEADVDKYILDIIELQMFLKESKGYHVDYEEFFLIFPDINLAMSSTYRDNLSRFFEYYYGADSISEVEWRKTLLQNNYATCRRLTDAEGNDVIEFMYQVPLYGSGDVSAVAVARMDYKLFQSIIDNYSDNPEVMFYIYDRTGKAVFTGNGAEKYPVPLISEHKLVNESDFESDSETKISTSGGFTYLSIFPESVYGIKMRYINFLNLFNVLFSVIFSVLLFYYVMKKYFFRIKKTLSKFRGVVDGNKYENEVEMINGIYREYISVKHRYANLKKDTEYRNFLEMLFKNSMDYSLGSFDGEFKFKYDTFCVGCFKILDIEKILEEADFNYTYIIIQNIFEEIIGQKYCCYVTFVDGRIAVLFNLEEGEREEFLDFLSENAEKVNDIIKKNFDFEFVLYISGFYSGIKNITSAYNEVCDLIRFRTIDSGRPIKYRLISNRDVKKEEKEYTHELFEKTKTLIGLIEYGDYRSAETLCKNIEENYITKIDVESVKMFISNLESELLKIIYGLNPSKTDDYYKELCCLASCNVSNELFAAIKELIRKLCIEKKENKTVKQNKNEITQSFHDGDDSEVQHIISNIIEYINCNYADNNLNIAMIGDYFNIAPYYISNQFKKSMNISMIDYINKVRTDKAKEIMENTDLPVSQIAVDVGFNNVRTFMRAFMKYESVTPGKYKKIRKK